MIKNYIIKNKKQISTMGVLFLIIVIGTTARIIMALQAGDLWFDELVSTIFATEPISSLWSFLQFENNPPLFFYLLNIWESLLGKTDFILRSFSILISIPTIITLYFFGKSLYGKKVGLISSLIFSVSVFAIYFGSEVRMYSMLFLFSSLSLFYFWRIVSDKPSSFVNYVFYVLATTAALYTHITALELLAIQGLFIIIDKNSRKHFFKYALLITIPLILFTPWLYSFAIDKITIAQDGLLQNAWYFKRSELYPLFLLMPSIYLFNFLFSGITILMATNYLIAYIPFIFGIIYAYSKKRTSSHSSPLTYILAIYIIPLLVTSITYNIPSWRYYIPSAIGFIILFSIGLMYLFSNTKIRNTIVMPFLIGIIILVFYANYSLNSYDRGVFKKLANYIEKKSVHTIVSGPNGIAVMYYLDNSYSHIRLSPPEMNEKLINDLSPWQYMLRYNWNWDEWDVINDKTKKILKEEIPKQLPYKKTSFIYLENNSYTDILIRLIIEQNGWCSVDRYKPSSTYEYWWIYNMEPSKNNPNCLPKSDFPELEIIEQRY